MKLKRSPKNLELNINLAKMGNSTFFHSKQQIPWQMANSAEQCVIPRAAEYWWPCCLRFRMVSAWWLLVPASFYTGQSQLQVTDSGKLLMPKAITHFGRAVSDSSL